VTLGNYLRTEVPLAKNALLHDFCRRRLQKLAWLLPLFLSAPAIAQKVMPEKDPAQKSQAAASPIGAAASPIGAPASPIKYAGIIYVSGNRRDPFLHPQHYRKNAPANATTIATTIAKTEDEEISRGVPPPGIAGTYIAQAKLDGIAVDANRRIAVVRGAESRAYFLKEGDRLFDGYLKSIQDDSIILVREIKMRSGKFYTQEVTKRLRTP
jgi:hypothetical protein